MECIHFAREHDLTVAVRGGGHQVAGFGTVENGMVIDLSQMKKISVDTRDQTARAQPGLNWGEFDKKTQEYGLATTGGLVSDTGISGLTLGGGIGWLVREYGLSIDNLISVEIITADAKKMVANEKENPDLFWGVRGGGGNFGIVTEYTFQLHPVGPLVYGGVLLYPMDMARDVLAFYNEWSKHLPIEMTTLAAFVNAPMESFVPDHFQGKPAFGIGICHASPIEQGEKLVRELRDFRAPVVDAVAPIPYITLQCMFDAGVPRGILSYWKSDEMDRLDDDTIDTIVNHAGKKPSDHTQVHIHHLDGAVAKMNEDTAAFSHRKTPYIMNIISMWDNPDDNDRNIRWTREFSDAMKSHVTGNTYLNFLGEEGENRLKAAYGEDKYHRLVMLKNKYDPTNFFHINHNIRPSS
jgi:FAD/FMN-containing dehydrogenase